MFKIEKREFYSWPVEHTIGNSGGERELMKFDALFKALPTSAVKDISERSGKGLDDDTFLSEVLYGWSGLAGKDGAEFAYNAENRRLLLELYPGLAGSIYVSWFHSVTGGIGSAANLLLGMAARKN